MQFKARALAGTPAGSEIARGQRASLERSHQSAGTPLPVSVASLMRVSSWKLVLCFSLTIVLVNQTAAV